MKAKLLPALKQEYVRKFIEAGCNIEAAEKSLDDILKGIEAAGIGPACVQCEGIFIMIDIAHMYFDARAPKGIIKLAQGIAQ